MNPNIVWTHLGFTFWSSIFHSNFYDLPLSLYTNICNMLPTVLILYFLASWYCICKIRFQINDYPLRKINTFTWICSMTKSILKISNNQIFSSASWYVIIYSVTSPFTTSCFYWYWQHICYGIHMGTNCTTCSFIYKRHTSYRGFWRKTKRS